MFEQSVLPSVHTKRPVTFMLVTAAELLMIAAAVAVPLFLIPPLIPPKLPIPLRFTRAVTLVRAEPKTIKATPAARRIFTPPGKFYAPSRVPVQVAPVQDIGSIETPDVSLSGSAGGQSVFPEFLKEPDSRFPQPRPSCRRSPEHRRRFVSRKAFRKPN